MRNDVTYSIGVELRLNLQALAPPVDLSEVFLAGPARVGARRVNLDSREVSLWSLVGGILEKRPQYGHGL